MASNRKFNVPINLLSLASNPASADEGDIYYNTTDDRIRVYKNGAWVNLAYSDDVGITSVDYITFDTTPEASSTETGTMFWDSGDGIPKVILNANVELGLGQEQVAHVKMQLVLQLLRVRLFISMVLKDKDPLSHSPIQTQKLHHLKHLV